MSYAPDMTLAIYLFVLSTFFLSVHSALVNVTCFPEYIEVEFDKQALKGCTPYIDGDCKQEMTVNATNTSIFVKIPLFDCGTETELAEDYIAFYYKIKIRVDNPGPIIRADDVYPVGCIWGPTHGQVTRNKKPIQQSDALKSYLYGKGSYTFKMEIYESDRFEKKVNFPLSLKIKEKVHFELSVNETGKDIALAVQECVATPSVNLTDELRYAMIKDSCLLDHTMLEYKPPHPTLRRYSFESFRFKKKAPMVYLHCTLRVCAGKNMTYCEEGCTTTGARRRRSSDDDDERTVTLGPIFFSNDDPDSQQTHNEEPFYVMVIGFFAAAALLCCGIIIGAVVYKKRQHYTQAESNELV